MTLRRIECDSQARIDERHGYQKNRIPPPENCKEIYERIPGTMTLRRLQGYIQNNFCDYLYIYLFIIHAWEPLSVVQYRDGHNSSKRFASYPLTPHLRIQDLGLSKECVNGTTTGPPARAGWSPRLNCHHLGPVRPRNVRRHTVSGNGQFPRWKSYNCHHSTTWSVRIN